MLQKFLAWFIQLAPSTKRAFWKWWYNFFAKKAQNPKFQFMNYGYSDDGFYPKLEDIDEAERYPIHLYHHVASQIDLAKKSVLEVGSGRGGGASYLARYLKPSSIIAIDISKTAIDLCNEIHSVENLFFKEGSSENIPSNESAFDVVLNVESSHCYGNVDVFFSEVFRVLKPGGSFVWCDFRHKNDIANLKKQFNNSGLQLVNLNDISVNVLSALKKMSVKRKALIKQRIPFFLRSVFESYAGVEGSKINELFQNGDLIYLSALLQKPE